MNDYSDTERQFISLSRSWYAEANMREWKPGEDEIMVGLYDEEGGGGTKGEFSIHWYNLGTYLAPQIEIFNDAWKSAFQYFQDVLTELSDLSGDRPSPEEVEKILIDRGVKDATEETRENGNECIHDVLESVHYGNGIFVKQCPICEYTAITIQG